MRYRNVNCLKCGNPIEINRLFKYCYCKACHAANMRKNRPKHSELSDEERKKLNARAYTHVYIKRGKLIRQACEQCGDANTEAHHEDYDKPLEVNWLCRQCHMKLHMNRT